MTQALRANSLCGFNDASVEAIDSKGIAWRWFTGNDEDGDGFTAPVFAAVSDDGRIEYFNWSRFGRFDAGHFRMYVELDFPDSPERRWGDGIVRYSPWQPDELAAYFQSTKETRNV